VMTFSDVQHLTVIVACGTILSQTIIVSSHMSGISRFSSDGEHVNLLVVFLLDIAACSLYCLTES